MSQRPPTSYDELPYVSHPLHASHPENLAAKALLHGLQAPDVRQCRMLELGCSTGGNLIPLAQILPACQFVGIDHAARQIAAGQASVQALGLQNLELRALSLAECDASLGTFDYIVCHGVYSWVSAENQRRILEVIARNLSPQGVAYVSYNTYPGWHLRGMVRDILLQQPRERGQAERQVAQARAYLDFLAEYAPEQDSVYARLLKQEAALLKRTPDTYVFHEHLEDVNQPIYFRQFVARAAEHALDYLCEAGFSPVVAHFTPELQAQLDQRARDRIEYEQQIDYLCCGTFRRSLLCHAGAPLVARPAPQALTQLRLASRASPTDPKANLGSTDPCEFRTADGATITTTHPLVKSALVHLFEQRPRSVPYADVVQAAIERAGRPADPVQSFRDSELLQAALLRCHECGLVETHLAEPTLAKQVGERPVAARHARFQAAQGEPISNVRHRLVELNDVDRFLLTLLDGQHDQAMLRDRLVQMTRDGVLVLEKQGQPVGRQDDVAPLVQRALQLSLAKMAELALLVE